MVLWGKMNLTLFILLLTGIILLILGWFLDKAHRFTWILKLVSRDAVNSLTALNILAQNRDAAISPEHPSFEVILKRWPNLDDIESVKLIGRTVAYTKHGTQVINDFALMAFDENKNEIKPAWEASIARSIFEKELDLLIFKLGAYIFYLGIAVTLVSGILGLVNH